MSFIDSHVLSEELIVINIISNGGFFLLFLARS